MADLSIVAGATSQSINVDLWIVATGAAQTGLVFNSSGLTAYYSFTGANTASVQITLATLATLATAYASGGFKEIDSTNMPGLYRLDLPNAAVAASKGREVCVTLNGFSGMAARTIKIELTGWDNQDGVHGGLTSLPNTAVTTNASLITSGAGTDQISNSSGKVLLQATQSGVTIPTVTTVTNQLTAAAIATGVWQDSTSGDFTTSSSIGKSLYTSGVVPGGSGGLLISGSNSGTTTLGALTVTGATTYTGAVTMAAGLAITQSVSNSNGLSITGNGTGSGAVITSGSGATGDGVKMVSAATAGNGLTLTHNGSAVYDLNATTTNSLAVNVTAVAGAASNIKKDQALSGFVFLMTDSTTHAPKTGLTVTSQVSLNGGSFGATANSATEISNGLYTINLAAADTNGNTVTLRFTATGADDRILELVTQP